MGKPQCLLFVWKQLYICYYIICMTVPVSFFSEWNEIFSRAELVNYLLDKLIILVWDHQGTKNISMAKKFHPGRNIILLACEGNHNWWNYSAVQIDKTCLTSTKMILGKKLLRFFFNILPSPWKIWYICTHHLPIKSIIFFHANNHKGEYWL